MVSHVLLVLKNMQYHKYNRYFLDSFNPFWGDGEVQ